MRLRVIYVTMCAIACLLLGGCSKSTPSNLPTPAPLVAFTPSITVNELWSVNAGRGAAKYYLRLTPVAANGKIFVPSYDGRVLALDASSGARLWVKYPYSSIRAGLSAAGDTVFVAAGNGNVIALSQANGTVLWQAPVGSELLASPTPASDTLLVKGLDGSLTALSQKDGRQLWRFTQPVPSLILHASSQPQVAAGIVVVGYASGKLVAVDVHTGQTLWSQQIGVPTGTTDIERMVDIDVSPVVVHGVVYAASYQGRVAAIDLKTGRLLWRHKVSAYSGIAADYKAIYLADADGNVWAFDEDSGAVLWRQDKLKYRNVSAPALFGQYVVVGDGSGYVHWLSKTDGHFVARTSVGTNAIIAQPIVSDNTLYVYASNGKLSAFRMVR